MLQDEDPTRFKQRETRPTPPLLNPQHRLRDEEVDDQAGGVDKRGDERVGKDGGVNAQLLAHQWHHATDGGCEGADAHQGQADD